MAKKATPQRDYKEEYRSFHGKPEQIKNRAARNKARSQAVKDGRVEKGDSSREVDHVRPLSKSGSTAKSNTRVISKEANRKKADKMPSETKKKDKK